MAARAWPIPHSLTWGSVWTLELSQAGCVALGCPVYLLKLLVPFSIV